MGAILAILSNPAIISALVTAGEDAVQFVMSTINMHKAGELTDAQITALWSAAGASEKQATDALRAAIAARPKT